MNTLRITKAKSFYFYPTLLISLCALFTFYKYVLQIFPSVITEQLMRDFHLNGIALGNLAATFYYAYLLTQLFVGIILDKFNLRTVITVAVFACALGTLVFAYAATNLTACLARLLMGVGVAFAPIAYMKVAAIWCPKQHYAFINGLMATTSMLGAVFGESVLSHGVALIGWRQSIFFIAQFGLLLTLMCWQLIKSESSETSSLTIPLKLSHIFRSRQNWLLCLYGGFAFSPLAIFGGLWGNPFLQQAYHLTKTQAAAFISLVFIGLAIGSPVLGILSDRIKQRKKVMWLGTSLSLIALLCIIYGNNLPLTCIRCCLFTFGFGLGSYMLVFTIGKEINSLTVTASVVALINASEAVLDSIAEPLIGKLLDLGWNGVVVNGAHVFSLTNYHNALWILPMCMSVALIILYGVREPASLTTLHAS